MIKKLQFIGLGIFIGLIITGLVLLVCRPPSGSPVIILPTDAPGEITIYINGAVNQVGVYSLPFGSRLQDGLIAAGGLSADADVSSLNLAKLLSDEEFIHIYKVGEAYSASAFPYSNLNDTKGIITNTQKVDINHATMDEIMNLPGIGATKANAIITFRSENGFFKHIDDLLLVNGIGPSILEQISGFIEILP